MSDACRLRQTIGVQAHCEEETCVYWRAVDHLEIGESAHGCAIQYFELLDGGADIAEWLMSVKQRLESSDTTCASMPQHEQG